MASITKQKTGWRAQISVKGVRDSAVKATKAQAQAWAVEREAQMRRMSETGVNTEKTCQDAFTRYAAEVSVHKRGAAWEAKRLTAIAAHVVNGEAMGGMKLCNMTSDTMGQWRDMRLNDVVGSTIVRDMALLSHVFATARKEWKWITTSPTTDVRRPDEPPARDRRISEDEIKEVLSRLGFTGEVATKSQRVAAAFLFAIETAMRAGEICALQHGDIVGSVATLQRTKNGTRREVPLSPRALELLALIPKDEDNQSCFGITPTQIDSLYRKARKGKGLTPLVDLKFHDTRHEAITRLAKKLPVLELARAVGHRDINMLLIYYNETAANLAKLL